MKRLFPPQKYELQGYVVLTPLFENQKYNITELGVGVDTFFSYPTPINCKDLFRLQQKHGLHRLRFHSPGLNCKIINSLLFFIQKRTQPRQECCSLHQSTQQINFLHKLRSLVKLCHI